METELPTLLGLPLLAWIPLFPLLGALINLTLGSRLSKTSIHTIAVASVVAACGISGYLVFGPLWEQFRAGSGGTGLEANVYTWLQVGSFKAELAFRLDTLSAVMILIVTFVGSWIHIYSTGYMHDEDNKGYARYFGYLNLFMGAMLILVLAANLPVMFIGWEGVGLCSFLLIGFWYENDTYAYAGRKAFVVNRIGDFCFLLGMFLLFWATKTLDFADLKTHGADFAAPFWGGERLAAAAGILLFIGACGKSAQLPLFVWLPDAMAGPTPVSALIHAATMVTAGVYMVCRLSFLYAASTTALIVVATVGALTALLAAFMAIAQNDLKKVLAYSTVSQLGFMFVAAGTGNWVAAIFHLGAHAFFKACLFLGAGSVMHGMHHGGAHDTVTQGDITKMGGLRKLMPYTHLTFAISCLAIAGIFPFSGFFSKDEILSGAFNVAPPGWPPLYGKLLWGVLLIAAFGTAFYMWRLYFMVFGSTARSDYAKKAHESPASMTVPLFVLAFFATFVGFLGLPHLAGVHLPGAFHALASWLEPSVAPDFFMGQGTPGLPIHGEVHDVATLLLMGGALMIGGIGIAIAWMFYGRGPSPSLPRIANELGVVYEASKHKLWFDEIYDALIVRPFKVVARGLYEIADRFIIDTVAVNGAAFVVGLFGRLSRWIQNGQVQRYLVGLVIGAAAVFLVTDCRHKADFDYHQVGDMIEFDAKPGAGLAGNRAKLEWDFDGDGKPDIGPNGQPESAPVVKKRLGDVGATVTLWVEDPISHDRTRITKDIVLGEGQP
ncbi:MAG TPA: NADH-quinone oxidoreductase subunit L [Kofleriaceae bacterium]|jgi:NADH-quinone oxidoreductase subunit L